MSITLEQSYHHCHTLMRSVARNFYYGMQLLPPDKRRGMFALYAFMRWIDDMADDAQGGPPQHRIAMLEQCRHDMHQSIAGRNEHHLLWPAFGDTVRRFAIPVKTFDDAIDGQLQDMQQTTYQSFDELTLYCQRVASTVGIASIHIWGYHGDQAIKLASQRGIAFQLTNILRDLHEDSTRGRCYLPAEDLQRFGLQNWHFTTPAPPQFDTMMNFQIERADDFYNASSTLERLIHPDARPTLAIMTRIYRKVLYKIAAQPRAVLTQRISLGHLHKLAILAQCFWRANTPNTPTAD